MRKRLFTLGLLSLAAVSQVSAAFTCKKWFNKTGKTNNGYAIILIGGTEDAFKHEASKAYQYLINVEGYSKSNVRIYGQDTKNYDYDGDGKSDMWATSAAFYKNQSFSFLKNNSTVNTDIFITVIDHGFVDGVALFNNDLLASELSDALDNIKFKQAKILISACHSGSFIDDIKRNNVTIVTTAPANNYGWFGGYGDLLSHEFYKALGGGYVGENPVDADYNKDGKVSWEEAFVYAKDHDKYTKPNNANEEWYTTPRYWSYDTPWRFCRPEDWGVVTQGNVYGTVTKEAMYSLIGNGVIASGSNVTFNSGKMIRLQKGFKVVKGAKFRTSHFDCEAEKRENEAELRSLVRSRELEEEINEVKKIEVYPNPSDGEFYFELGERVANISIYDSFGRCVEMVGNATGTAVINLTGKAKGIYNAVVSSETGNETIRIIVR